MNNKTAFMLVLFAVVTRVSIGATISTGDGLSLGIASNGNVNSIKLNNSENLRTSLNSGIFVKNMPSGVTTQALGTATQTAPDRISFTGTVSGMQIQITAQWTSFADRIECQGTIVDTSGTDRAIQLTPTFQLNGANWKWAGDIGDPVIVTPGMECTKAEPMPWPRTMNVYPFSCAINPGGNGALSLSTRMDYPRVFRNRIKQQSQYATFTMETDLGLSTATSKFPSSATFFFCLQNTNASLGFRDAAAKYYAAFPQFYQSSASKIGAWTLDVDTSMLFFWEFGLAYNEMQLNPNGDPKVSQIAFNDQYGVLSIAYSEPQGYWQGYGIEGQLFNPDTDLTQSVLQAPFVSDQYLPPDVMDCGLIPGIGRAAISQAVLHSAITDSTGTWQHIQLVTGRWGGGYAGWTMLCLNPDPDVTATNRENISWQHEYLGVANLASSNGAQLDGVFVDSVQGFSGLELDNYNRNHWAVADVPLTFSYSNNQPVQMHGMQLYEYLNFLRTECNSRNWIMFANGYIPHYSYTAHFFDAMGATENNVLTMGETWARALRVIAGRKPVSFLDYKLIQETQLTDQQMQDSFNLMLLYDLMPGTGDWYAASTIGIERARTYMRKYIPEFIMLGEAGWQPVTGATGSNLKIERYGTYASGNLAFAVNNSSASAVSNVQVTIDRSLLGIGATDKLKAIRLPDYTSASINLQTNTINVGDLAAGETVVLRVGTVAHLDAFKRNRCMLYVNYLSNLKKQTFKQDLKNIINIDLLSDKCLNPAFDLLPVAQDMNSRVAALTQSRGREAAMFYLGQIISTIEISPNLILEMAPCDDAVVKEENPDINFNLGDGLPGVAANVGKVGSVENPHRYYSKVDLSSLRGYRIVSASLTLYHLGRDLDVKSTSSNWSESSITWNNQPGSWSSWTGNLGGWYDDTWARRSVELDEEGIAEVQNAIDNSDGKYSLVLYYEGTEPYPWAHASTWLKESQFGFGYLPVFTISALATPSTCGDAISEGFAVEGDLNYDCYINFADFAILASNWLTLGIKGDMNYDNNINFKDLEIMSSNWLTCIDPITITCETPWFK